MSYRRCLVATDFSPNCEAAARASRSLVEDPTLVRIVHVLPDLVYGPYMPIPDEAVIVQSMRRMENEAFARLDGFARDAGLEGATTRVLSGSVARAVTRESDAIEADLVALGAGTKSPVARFILGSSAKAILRSVHADVLIVRADEAAASRAEPFERILVATDFSPASAAAARRAAELADATGASIAVTHALDPAVWASIIQAPDVLAVSDTTDVMDRARLERALRAALTKFNDEHLGGRAEEILASGPAAKAVAKEAEDRGVDLVVVGTHGPGIVERALLGSVAEGIAVKAPCSVLVARARAGGEAGETERVPARA
ncbi:MAG TPA: universal stress protein [Candidatus Thermoplasmatota archaeon]|nr:universal stress protein [Candidatus Thermoplasmatota archaeon]